MKRFCLKTGEIVTIRVAEKSDAKELIGVVNRIGEESEFLTFGRGEFKMTVEQEEAYLEAVSKQSNSVYFVAEINGKIAGLVSFAGGTRPRTEHTGELSVSVLKEYWGMGIGRRLMEELIEWAKGTGIIRKINLRVRKDNERAIRLYKKLGFTESGIISREMQVNGVFYDNLCMGYEIDPD
ncbi:MAG: Spermidine N(1)-acetyltransferase [Firmicutes bacterium ADurb.Bin182]|nr:MAG: Spermidine N(1)-acetyltransferase [Firmicutes bacterium ADurb.Bin182]